jgi:hypothetical protein
MKLSVGVIASPAVCTTGTSHPRGNTPPLAPPRRLDILAQDIILQDMGKCPSLPDETAP